MTTPPLETIGDAKIRRYDEKKPLTRDEIAELKRMEWELLGRPPCTGDVSQAATMPTPQLRAGARPGALGWIQTRTVAPPATAAVTPAPWGEPVRSDVGVVLPRRRPEEHDAPVLIRAAHEAYPSWTPARISEFIGLPEWLCGLVVAQSCRVHSYHGRREA